MGLALTDWLRDRLRPTWLRVHAVRAASDDAITQPVAAAPPRTAAPSLAPPAGDAATDRAP